MHLSFGTNITHRLVTWLTKIQVFSLLLLPVISEGTQLTTPCLNQRKSITSHGPVTGVVSSSRYAHTLIAKF